MEDSEDEVKAFKEVNDVIWVIIFMFNSPSGSLANSRDEVISIAPLDADVDEENEDDQSQDQADNVDKSAFSFTVSDARKGAARFVLFLHVVGPVNEEDDEDEVNDVCNGELEGEFEGSIVV